MGRRRKVNEMLTISDGYVGFVNKKRFWRFLFATLTFFAMFAVVVSFFDIESGTKYAYSNSKFMAEHADLTRGDMEENERVLAYIYIFFPTPLAAAWVIVYFGKFWSICKVEKLRNSKNYKYNLLVASLVMAAIYAVFLGVVMGIPLASGSRLRAACLLAFCEFSLILIEVFAERKARQQRYQKKKIEQQQEQAEDEAAEAAASSVSPVPSTVAYSQPGGML